MNSVRELTPTDPPRSVLLHQQDSSRVARRLFVVRCSSRIGGVLDCDGLPRIGERHPDDDTLECHALLPRRVRVGFEVWALYRPAGAPIHIPGSERRAAA